MAQFFNSIKQLHYGHIHTDWAGFMWQRSEKSYSFMWLYSSEFIDHAAMVLLLTKVTNEHEVRSETCQSEEYERGKLKGSSLVWKETRMVIETAE